MKLYYILNNVVSGREDLPVGPRIKSQSSNIIMKYKDGDRPFSSLKDLRKNSSIYKKLLRENPRRAQKICEKKYIIQIRELVPILDSTTANLGNAAFDMLSHIVSGKVKDKKSYGGHLFNSTTMKIEKITNTANKKGVWEALVSIKDFRTGSWIKKESPTTFFPNWWSKALLLLKLELAYLNRKEESQRRHVGKTDCGIVVIFVFRNNKIVSAYPIYE